MKTPMQELTKLVDETTIDMIPRALIQIALPKLLENEKQMIIDACNESYTSGVNDGANNFRMQDELGEQYYNETFK